MIADLIYHWGSRYVCLTGTSQAAGHASGAVARLLEKEPGLTPAEVKSRLLERSLDEGVPDAQGLLAPETPTTTAFIRLFG